MNVRNIKRVFKLPTHKYIEVKMFIIFLCMHGFAALKSEIDWFDFINISVRAAVHCVTSTMKILYPPLKSSEHNAGSGILIFLNAKKKKKKKKKKKTLQKICCS